MLPTFLSTIFGVNIPELIIRTAMEEIPCPQVNVSTCAYALAYLHSDADGIPDSIFVSEKIRPYVIRETYFAQPGEPVYYFENASKAFGYVTLAFPSAAIMDDYMKKTPPIFIRFCAELESTNGGRALQF